MKHKLLEHITIYDGFKSNEIRQRNSPTRRYFILLELFFALLLQFYHLPIPLLLMKIQNLLWQLKCMYVSIFSMLCESIENTYEHP